VALKPDLDVVITGAGPAGALLASYLGQEGFDIGLIDVARKENFWDQLKHTLVEPKTLKLLGLDINEEALYNIKEISIKDAKGKELSVIETNLVILDGLDLSKHIVNLLEDSNVRVIDKHLAMKLDISSNGVFGVGLRGKRVNKLTARITVDATGAQATLRKQLRNLYEDAIIDEYDLVYTYVEEFPRQKEISDNRLHVFIGSDIAPGAYAWYHSISDRLVRLGIGIQLGRGFELRLQERTKLLKGILFLEGKNVSTEARYLVTRRPLTSLVYSGFVLVGQSAGQGNPIVGGGIAGCINAAIIAAKNIRKALETAREEIVPIEDLWPYNVEYLSSYGKYSAILDVIRIFAQGMGDAELYTFTSKIPKKLSMDLEYLAELSFSNLDFVLRPRFFWKAFDAFRLAERVDALYGNYPRTPEGFKEWHHREVSLFNELKNKVWAKRKEIY